LARESLKKYVPFYSIKSYFDATYCIIYFTICSCKQQAKH